MDDDEKSIKFHKTWKMVQTVWDTCVESTLYVRLYLHSTCMHVAWHFTTSRKNPSVLSFFFLFFVRTHVFRNLGKVVKIVGENCVENGQASTLTGAFSSTEFHNYLPISSSSRKDTPTSYPEHHTNVSSISSCSKDNTLMAW